MMLLTFGNTMFDQGKDVMMLNVLGAQSIPFLQVYAVLPMSLVFLWGYQLLQRVLPRRSLFPVIISTFAATKLLAANFLLPKSLGAISAHAAVHGSGVLGLAKAGLLQQYATPMLFYGLCELYGDVVLGVLFWGFAIQATPHKLVRKLLPLYCIGANLAQILTGQVLQLVAGMIPGAMDQIQVCFLLPMDSVCRLHLHPSPLLQNASWNPANGIAIRPTV